MKDVPRRIRLDLNEPAELAIYNAIQEVEKLPPAVKLTQAVILLGQAKNLVADFIDAQTERPNLSEAATEDAILKKPDQQ